MTFQDRVVLITGASNGIGRRLAIDLAARGAIVVGCGRSLERLQAPNAAHAFTIAIECDVAKLDQVRQMVTGVLSKFGRIDILINNAGIGMRKPFAETPIDVIEELMRTNYLGAVYCTHEALPSMIARGSGHIVNISSAAGKLGALNIAGYCASKFAMNGLSESLYYELKPFGIDVSVICPGPVRTDFNRSFADTPVSRRGRQLNLSQRRSSRLPRTGASVALPRWLALICWLKNLTQISPRHCRS
jgi:NAD(P)-dependent dehydrogenase (short-subunit alcohol dehydrogenase family)